MERHFERLARYAERFKDKVDEINIDGIKPEPWIRKVIGLKVVLDEVSNQAIAVYFRNADTGEWESVWEFDADFPYREYVRNYHLYRLNQKPGDADVEP